jgi:hypothetical protein
MTHEGHHQVVGIPSLGQALASSTAGFTGEWIAYLLDTDTALVHDLATDRLSRVTLEFLRWLVHARLGQGESISGLLARSGDHGN